MASAVAASPFALHKKFSSCVQQRSSSTSWRPSFPFQGRLRGFQKLYCQTNPDPIDSSRQEELQVEPGTSTENHGPVTAASTNVEVAAMPNKSSSRRIAVASTAAAVGLFLSTRLEFGVSLGDLTANAVPYEQALSNGLPTVVEFYADWCEVCRELTPDVYQVEKQFKDRVNFVMLNVDNTKWEQELDEFGVEGIPHFAFLDKDGNEEGNVVGRLPKKFLLENVVALANGEPSIPHSRIIGQYSNAEARKLHRVVDPRSHG
ncbi:thioredoxin-like protein HCF164, chloroplastic [Aristolochia californica]|uniref:thioredoxin-like protein HCF164, chloroplastic n=1 Tax=Aristolochia californica TaxID=171875 RepID=UPI0035DE8756